MGDEKRNSIWPGDHNSSRTNAKFRIVVRRFGKLTGEGARLTLCPLKNGVLEQKEKPDLFRNGFCFSKNSPGYFRARAIRVPCKMSSAKLP
jgi:hypothetical protein